MDIAFEKTLELYAESLKLDDGVERIIGLVVNPQIQNEFDEILTIFRDQTKQQIFKVRRNDFSFACDKLCIGDPDKVTDGKEYVFNDVNNFDLIKNYLKQNHLLAWSYRS